jgi:WD40 repeat protein
VNVAFSADGKRIVTASGDETARVYDATTGALQLELKQSVGEAGIECAAISPDGTQIATGCKGGVDEGGVLKLWDARTGKTLRKWQADKFHVTRVAFNPDGARIVTGGFDQAVKVWDARTAALLLDAKGMMSHWSSVAFSPDGTRLVAGRDDRTARVIDARTGAVLLELKGRQPISHSIRSGFGPEGVLSVAFSPDGTRIATAGGTGGYGNDEGGVSVWDARTGAELLELKGHKGMVWSVAFSPDGERIISGSADGTAKVWDARTGTPWLELEGIKSPIECVASSPDGSWIVTGGGEFPMPDPFQMPGTVQKPGEATVWDARTGRPKLALKGCKYRVSSVAVSKDGTRIVTGAWGIQTPGEAIVWDAQTGQALFELKGSQKAVTSVAISPDGERIITAGGSMMLNDGSEVKVWDARTGKLLRDLTKPHHQRMGMPSMGMLGARVSVAFSSDGKRFVVAGVPVTTTMNEGVTVYDAKTGATLLEMGNNDGPRSVAFSRDGARIATGNYNKSVTIWDAETGKVLLELKGHTSDVNSVAFSPDGTRIVTGSQDKTAKVWDARTGMILAELKGHTSVVNSVAFSPDGMRIITAGLFEVFVWDAPLPRLVELVGHMGGITTAAFSLDNTRIATSSEDKTVKIWDARTGHLVVDLKGFPIPPYRLALSADGRLLATGDAELMPKGWGGPGGDPTPADPTPAKETVKVWDATTGKQLAELNVGRVKSMAFAVDGTRLVTEQAQLTKVWDVKTGKELPGEPIPEKAPSEQISADRRFFARLYQDRAEVVPLVADENELAYRRLHTQPKLSRYRAGYLAARTAKDDFAAAFYLNLIPPDERPDLLAQAELNAFQALGNLVEAHVSARKLEEAAKVQIEILNINKAKLGPQAPETMQAAETLGLIYVEMGQCEKAIPLLEEVVKYRKANPGQWHVPFELINVLHVMGATEALALAYKDVGHLREAIALLEETANWPGGGRYRLLDAYELAGEHAKIIALCDKLLAAAREPMPGFPLAAAEGQLGHVANLHARLGRANLGLKKWPEAEAHLCECVVLQEKNWPNAWTTFDAQSMLGASLLGQKKYKEAEPLLLKGYEGLKLREKSIPRRGGPVFRKPSTG